MDFVRQINDDQGYTLASDKSFETISSFIMIQLYRSLEDQIALHLVMF